MSKNLHSLMLHYTVIVIGLCLILISGYFLNQFELSGDVTLDYFRFMGSLGGIIVGCMSVIISIVGLGRSK